MPTRIHELLDLPQAVRKGDFVQDLSGGIANPERTLKDYAITTKIVQTFHHALSIIGSALRDGRSQIATLHGSFGSGKSHFMAVLDLMLADHAEPWGRKELHPLRNEFPWIGQKKLVQLPIHMLGARSLESKILGTYVQWVRDTHPEATIPAVFADQGLFADAQRLRTTLGDPAFFAKLNGAIQAAASGWGRLADTQPWSAASFEEALSGAYEGDAEKDASNPRARLFSDLVRAFFTSYSAQQDRFVDLDAGLGVVSRHAHGLGYDGIILYLDELVLWLAGNSGDLPFVAREVQKMVKLKEAQDANRAVPIVSFVAQQRDLSQFLGEQAQGAVRTELDRILAHHEGRFEHVILADSNLPAIVAHRVVRPRNDDARQMLHDDFARTWRAAGQAQSVLIGSEGDEADFRQVYPFSPALVEALVALSDCLQRERTAIRILMELLVDHLPDLELGRIVPVGDAFDALAESSDPIDDPLMKALFERARGLYRDAFLPMLQRQHGTDSPSQCQRLREDHDQRLGCSRCTQRACRDDNRLVKTLLMAALVPEAKPFKGLTVKRLVHLNHGSVSSLIPGAEYQIVAQRLRDWINQGQVGSLRLGEQADPEVKIHLSGVDLPPILAQAADADTPGVRKIALRKLLFEALEIDGDGAMVEAEIPFNGTRRRGRVRYGNVREMRDEDLTCPRALEWQLVLDYPFDDRGHGPAEDLHRLERYRDERAADATPNPSVVWLPDFFSHALEAELGRLVVLDHILDGDVRRYLSHLRIEDQATAREDLASLRAQKRAVIKRTLAQAYGLTMAESAYLDPSRSVDEHFVSLFPGFETRGVLAGNMKDGFHLIVDLLLSKRYPHHPHFDGPVNASKMERVYHLVDKLIDQRDRRFGFERAERTELRAYTDPLGITETGEAASQLRERPFQDLEQRRTQEGVDTPTVGVMRDWLDPQGTRGYPREVQDVLIALYATWAGRALQSRDAAVELRRPGQLADDVELVLLELPTPGEWSAALDRAGRLFGTTIGGGRSLIARNVVAFVFATKGAASEKRAAAAALPVALDAGAQEWGQRDDAPRLATARASAALLEDLVRADGAAFVRIMAAFQPQTSIEAMARSLTTAAASRAKLEEKASWIVFQQVKGLVHDPLRGQRAQGLLDDLRAVISADEINKMLADSLSRLLRQAETLLMTAPPPPPPLPAGEEVALDKSGDWTDRKDAAKGLRELADAVEAQDGEGLRIHASVTVWRRGADQ